MGAGSISPEFTSLESLCGEYQLQMVQTMWSGSEEGSYLRLIECRITQL